MRVLVFGSTGQVARELARADWAEGTLLTALDRHAADLSKPDLLAAAVRENAPDAVIIAAAYTKVDEAEKNEAAAMAANAAGPAAIAVEAAALGVPVVHISTDFVFDGEKGEPYVEGDPVAPVNAYGRSKLAGERAVRAANPRHLILRSAWIYAAEGTNFLRTMLRLARKGDPIRVVDDQRGCPTAARDLAQAIARVIPTLVQAHAPSGTYHLAGADDTTWHGFAAAIFEGLAARGSRSPKLEAIATKDYPTAARRPRDSRLSSERFARDFGFRLPGYKTALPAILDAALAATATCGEPAP